MNKVKIEAPKHLHDKSKELYSPVTLF